MKKLLLLAIVVLGISAVSFGQEGVTTVTINDANASATILKPLTVTKGATELNFGVLGATATDGTATVDANDGRTVSNVTAFTNFGATAKSAIFNISGTSNNQFSITLPSADVTLDGTGLANGETMVISAGSWVTTLGAFPDNNVGTLNDAGEFVIKVGATLEVSANQTPGNYQGTYEFTVTYE